MKDKDASKISTEKRFGGDYIEKYLYNGNIKEYNSYIKYFTKDGICKSVKYYSDKDFKHLYSTETRKYNPDGSYFAVTQYKEPMQGKILSAEGNCNKEERPIDAKFHFGKNRKKLFCSSRFKYNPDGSYVRTWIYEQPNKNGDLSIIENYDKDDKYISGKYYTDKNFSNLRLTETREYNPDGSYIGTWIYEQPDENGTLSISGNYDKDDKYISGKYYTDKNFSNLRLTETREYNPDSTYTQTLIYEQPNKNGDLSIIENFDKDNRYIGGKYYTDKSFSNLRLTETREYNPDESYIGTWIYEQPNKNGDLSIIENYDKDDKYISGKYYTDKNFSNLRLTETREYNPDGSYIGTWIYEQPDEYGDLSAITNYDKDNRYISGKYYTDKNFSKLRLTITREYNSDGSYSKTWIYEQPDEYGDLSAITNYDKDNRYIGGKYYTDKNFSKLRLTITREYNSDGSYSKTWIYEQPNKNGDLSIIENYDKDDKYISGKYYTDKNFSNLRLTETREYNPDGSYIGTWIYEQPNKNGTLSFIENYDKNDKYISGKYYTDKNFSNLRLTETREYNPDGSYIETGIYEQPNKNGNLSAITYNDKDEQCIHAISYKDKSFSVINRISLWKHTNEWSYCLRIYPNDDKTSCNADIEKYEKNSPNMIYKKPCNFKGNLERVNRLLS